MGNTDSTYGGLTIDEWLKIISGGINYFKNPDGIKMPNTPNETWLTDAIKQNLAYSPARDYASDFANQALKGISEHGAPQMTFKSNYLKGETPMGGYLPKIDFSRLPEYWRKPGSGANSGYGGNGAGGGPNASSDAPGGKAVGFGGKVPFQRSVGDDGAGGGAGGPLDGETIYDYYTRTNSTGLPPGYHGMNPLGGPNTSGSQPGDPAPGGQGSFGDGSELKDLFTRAVQWMKDNPALASQAFASGGAMVFAAIGAPAMAGTLIGKAVWSGIERMFGGGSRNPPPPSPPNPTSPTVPTTRVQP